MSTLSVLKIQQPLQVVVADAVRAIAATAEVSIDVKEISVTEVVKISPFVIMPVLTTEMGNIAGIAAVKSVEAGCSALTGRCPFVKAQIDQYLQVVPLIVEQVVAFKALEAAKSTDNDKINALNKLVQLVKPINDTLVGSTFLMGNTYTIADITLAVALREAFALYMGPKKRTELAALTRWFNTVTGQKAFLKTFGGVSAIQAKDVYLMPDLTNVSSKPEVKKDDPIAKMARSPMSLDAVKKLYCMERPYNPQFAAEFFAMFDAEGWELMTCEFKYPEDYPVAKKLFMAENGVNSFAQRADQCKKNVFVVLNMFEKNDQFNIKGAAIVRGNREINAGRDVPAPLADVGDAEEYSWTFVDSKTEEGKAAFIKAFCAENTSFDAEILVRTHIK